MKTRQVSGTVIYRILDGRPEILLVSKSNNAQLWGFPKGGVEPELSPRASAEKEAYEEAGVTGTAGTKLGELQFMRDGVLQHATFYIMQAGRIYDSYLEAATRKRAWFPVKAALKALDKYEAVLVYRLLERLDMEVQ